MFLFIVVCGLVWLELNFLSCIVKIENRLLITSFFLKWFVEFHLSLFLKLLSACVICCVFQFCCCCQNFYHQFKITFNNKLCAGFFPLLMDRWQTQNQNELKMKRCVQTQIHTYIVWLRDKNSFFRTVWLFHLHCEFCRVSDNALLKTTTSSQLFVCYAPMEFEFGCFFDLSLSTA